MEQGSCSEDDSDTENATKLKRPLDLLGVTESQHLPPTDHRHSATSLDSGRGSACASSSDGIKPNSSSTPLHLSKDNGVPGANSSPPESISSSSADSCNSSSSSGAQVEPKIDVQTNESSPIDLPQPMRQLGETGLITEWLRSVDLLQYGNCILDAGYELSVLAKAAPEDLIACGVTNPRDRQRMRSELSKLRLTDSWIVPVNPSINDQLSLDAWLKSLNMYYLYHANLEQAQIFTLKQVSELNWEDLQDLGINKL
ncbi:hypothetical protein Ciccas_002948, partial [Cichlidogyrus casuarinus]